MQSVRFLQAYQIYNRGEVAGFTPDEADKLIAAKVAMAWPHPPQQVKKETAPADTGTPKPKK